MNLHADGRLSGGVFWEVLKYLPRETREYLPKMIAVTMLGLRADAEAFGPDQEMDLLADAGQAPTCGGGARGAALERYGWPAAEIG